MTTQGKGRLQLLEKRQMLLVRFGQRLAGVTRLEPLLTLLASEMRHILGAERCSIFLLDKARKELTSHVAQGLEGRELRLPLGQGIAGAVAKSGTALNIPD